MSDVLKTEFHQSFSKGNTITVIDLFQQQVKLNPRKTAIADGKRLISYEELDVISNRIAVFLQKSIASDQCIVPVCMQPTIELVATLLGVLKSGLAFIPLHPDWPENRKNHIIKQVAAKWVLSGEPENDFGQTKQRQFSVLSWKQFSSGQKEVNKFPKPFLAGTLAYVMYTSGSTGVPKGVMVGHSQLYHATQKRINHYGCSPELLLIPAPTFDAAQAAIFWSLCTGGKLIMAKKESLQDIEIIPALLRGTDTLLCVPSYYRFLLEEGLLADLNMERVILGGESLPKELVDSHFQHQPKARLFNEYGPTETTIWATVASIQPDDKVISIGKPIPGVSCHVLGEDGKEVPSGGIGELFIGGDQVANGYWMDKSLTSQKFIPDPYADKKGARLYATGDLVSQLPDGRYLFEGRKDRQFKWQGNRIDPSEIEQAFLETGGIKEVLVSLFTQNDGIPDQIAAFVIPNGLSDLSLLREKLKNKLPAYLLPSKIETVAAFPLTENGKVDLPALLSALRQSGSSSNLPVFADLLQERLYQAFSQTLGHTNFGLSENFFEMGGNSLAAMHLLSILKNKLDLTVDIKDIFDFPTVSGLYHHIRNQEGQKEVNSLPELKADLPMVSPAQQSLWLIDHMEGSKAYHLPVAYQLSGDINPGLLEKAIRMIIRKHQVLRTTFLGIDQVSFKSEQEWNLTLINKTEEIYSREQFFKAFTPLFSRAFDLSADFMIRAQLVSFQNQVHVLGLVFHHIAFDDWSMRIFLRELSENYKFLEKGIFPDAPSAVFTGYAQFQQGIMESSGSIEGLDYWRQKLSGLEKLRLPRDFPFKEKNGHEAGVFRFTWDKELLRPLAGFGKSHDATPFMTLLAVFKVLLYRYSNQTDICVGTTVVDRNLPGTEETIGYFINTLPIRSALDPNSSFVHFLKSIRNEVLFALKYGHVPFLKLASSIAVSQEKDHKPFFDLMFVMHEGSEEPKLPEIPGIVSQPLNVDPVSSKFAITLTLVEEKGGIKGHVEFDKAMFLPETIQRMVAQFQELVRQLPKAPDKPVKNCNLLSANELNLLSGRDKYQEAAFHTAFFERFEMQVNLRPNATAIKIEGEEISFHKLNVRALQVADLLMERGVRQGELVALLVQRGLDMVAGILGIWKVGAAYVPVDPNYPQERINYILTDSAASYLLTDTLSEGKSKDSGKHLIVNLDKEKVSEDFSGRSYPATTLDRLAYVIYTSGSTGKPKGVSLTQANLAGFLDWCGREFSLDDFEVIYAVTSMCFDLSVFELFFPLAFGKPVRILPDALHIPAHLESDNKILINTVPSVVQKLVEARMDFSRVSLLNMAGEPVPARLLEKLDWKGLVVRNLYGPTEDTTYSTCQILAPGEPVSIGRPIAGSFAYILNQDLMPCPIGVPGEIYLGGHGVAAGYLNQPGFTSEKFIPDPFGLEGSPPIYKTGDLGAWTEEGKIDFLGRLDNQVKLNGHRIELDEVSFVLQSLKGVKNAVAVLQTGNTGEKQLVGFVESQEELIEKDLLVALSDRLPRYMVPSRIQILEKLPLTPNGKIDRKALETVKVNPGTLDESRPFEAPSSILENDLLEIWKKVLQFDGLGVKDDFFDCGGNSLLAIRLIGRIKESLGLDISISDLFGHPSVRQISALIERKGLKEGESERIPSQKPRPEFIPLSFGQESLWLTDKLEGSVQYHIPILLKIKGAVSSGLLMDSIRSIMERHEILRTVIKEMDEDTWQEVMPVLGWEMTVDHQAGNSGDLDLQMTEFLDRPFDLGNDFMLRARQFVTGENECLLMVVVHHIAFDGWSIPLFIKELFALLKADLSGESLLLPHLKIQYADYALWQRNKFTRKTLEKKLYYWKEHLRDVKPIKLQEPFSQPGRKNNEGETFDFQIGLAQKREMLELGKKLGLSPFMILLAVFKSLLERLSGQQDICVGTALGGRRKAEVEALLGYFVNPLPIRTYLDPDSTFTEILLQVKQKALEAYEHQDVPFEKIVASTVQSRELGVNPLFQVMFVMEYGNENQNFSQGLSMEVVPFQQNTSKFDLTFLVNEDKNGINIRIEYARALFAQKFIEKLSLDFASILDALLKNPGQKLKQVLTDQTSKTIGEVNYGKDGIEDHFTPVHRLIEDTVRNHGAKTAVIFGNQQLSFAELNSQANQLAFYLLERGLKKGDIVGLLLERSPKFLIGILAVLKAGGAYMPLDTDDPDYRINYKLEDSCSFCLTEEGVHSALETSVEKILWHDFLAVRTSYRGDNPEIQISPDDAAYIIYTSGTTGKPKGVRLDHINVYHFISVVNDQPGLSSSDRVLAVSSVSFDIAILETLITLVYGAQTFMLGQMERREPDLILDKLDKDQISIMFATPSHWKMLFVNGWDKKFEGLKIISGGEPLEKTLADRLLPLCKEVWNVYGPTETTVYSTIKQVKASDEQVTVGKPVSNTKIHILDTARNPVRKGLRGEIYIEGYGVGRGYINSPELTKEKFIEIYGEIGQRLRLYKTGDLGRINSADELEIAGRVDHQVKIRGYRLELGEVENAVRGLEGIGDAIVHVKRDLNEVAFLVAYIIPTSGPGKREIESKQLNQSQVRQWKNQLSLRLADYMVPTDFVLMERFPLMQNGKINRNALPYPDRVAHPFVSVREEMSPEERLVADIWKNALGLNVINKGDNFFEIGGHSLTAVRVMVQLEKAYGIKLPLSVLFRYPTVQKLSQALRSGVLGDSEWKSLVAIKTTGTKPPLYIIHGGGLNILPFYAVAKKMDRDQPVFGIQAKGLDGIEQPLNTVEEIANQYLSEVLKQNPDGPYFLAGYSLGGIIAFEMATQLIQMGKHVEKLVLFDTYAFQSDHKKPVWKRSINKIWHFIGKRKFDVELLLHQPSIFKRKKKASFQKKINKINKWFNSGDEDPESSLLKTYKRVEFVYKEACKEYEIKKYPGSVDLIKAKIAAGYLPDKSCFGWKPFVGNLRVWEAEGEHITMLSPPNDASFARLLQQVIDTK
ncbi:non-ribosomal peptide synthetase [Cyclobacterium sp.]|uniref:non-ribosomal peptide synthetase n=1 Tax=Cyclobacterium sp. TaxID=1966343 RepID=UPI0019ADD612|nr:non-ribosomal peptide synthetase [Cyclobacterium sp.]MBD3628494.1 amino acid adenylation domain-containing protein [Cyclobacterium sp.]